MNKLSSCKILARWMFNFDFCWCCGCLTSDDQRHESKDENASRMSSSEPAESEEVNSHHLIFTGLIDTITRWHVSQLSDAEYQIVSALVVFYRIFFYYSRTLTRKLDHRKLTREEAKQMCHHLWQKTEVLIWKRLLTLVRCSPTNLWKDFPPVCTPKQYLLVRMLSAKHDFVSLSALSIIADLFCFTAGSSAVQRSEDMEESVEVRVDHICALKHSLNPGAVCESTSWLCVLICLQFTKSTGNWDRRRGDKGGEWSPRRNGPTKGERWRWENTTLVE